jgi:formylglycine-generating enzyme required for sulfatase activity
MTQWTAWLPAIFTLREDHRVAKRRIGGADSDNHPHDVGSLKPNAFGLYDMHGNAAEWVQDFIGDYPAGPVIDPSVPKKESGESFGEGAGRRILGRSRYLTCAR